VSQLEVILDSIVIERPDIFEYPQHLCLDKGYTGEMVGTPGVYSSYQKPGAGTGVENGESGLQSPPLGY
jgi:hypothetical protein